MRLVDADSPLNSVDMVTLEPLVQRLLNRNSAKILDWQCAPIKYDIYLPGRLLARYTGRALVEGKSLPWSLVLKLTHPPNHEDGTSNIKWKREVLAYKSGLLSDLIEFLTAPRTIAVIEDKTGTDWLWLEDVVDLYDRKWPLQQFGRAARQLGQFNGAYLTTRPLPDFPWLVQSWTELHSEPAKIPAALAEIEELASDNRVREAFPRYSASEMTQLLRDQPRFVEKLSRLPQTLCHHDASQANLFARRRADGRVQTVAIDWESLGNGTVGAEIATLVFGTIRRGHFSAERIDDLDREVFAGYLKGLRDAGWSDDPAVVRLGYVGAVALRWFFLHGTLRVLTDSRVRAVRGTISQEQEKEGQAVQQFILLSTFLLDCADEARTLASRYLS